MAARSLETNGSDYDKETGTQASESKLGDLAVPLEKLLLENAKISPNSFYGVRIDTAQLNSMFRPLLPSDFNFGKSAPPHRLLDIAMKCQMARSKEQSKAGISLRPAIENLGRLWYRELIQELERQP
jgi:hypothetical protein